jgi:ABC-type Fe3+/spermidine/putrescine transport system ATPase subunit
MLGLLGPNGAGEATAVRVLTTLLKPEADTVRVAGLDVVRHASQVRGRIGQAGQYAALDANLTALENLVMVGRLCGHGRGEATQRGRLAGNGWRCVCSPRMPRLWLPGTDVLVTTPLQTMVRFPLAYVVTTLPPAPCG